MTETACDTNTVTPLRQRMEEQLRIANLAASTSKAKGKDRLERRAKI